MRMLLVLVALVAAALALRAVHPQRWGIDHFDEGVYAFSASAVAGAEEGARAELYAGQERFSPPLYFGAAGLLARATGLGVDRALVWLNVVLGALTVGLLGLVGWRWLGAPAGAAAAALLAFSEAHVDLSRSGLTDVAFGFLHLLALFLLVEALRGGRASLALLGGVATGAAWNTKYHGWLALVGAALAFAPSIAARVRSRTLARPLALWVLAAAVAGGLYAPWAWHVHTRAGGYGALAAYQRTMLRPGWLENLARHAEQQLFLEGPLSRAALLAALACACAVATGGVSARRLAAAVALGAAAGLAAGGTLGAALLTLLALPVLLRRARALDPGALAVLAWLGLWLLLTPLYQPYARLFLPLAMGCALAAGAAIQALVEAPARGARPLSRVGASGLALACAAAVGAAALALPDPGHPWRPSRGASDAAREALAHLPPDVPAFVLGAPELAWYLRLEGRRAHPVGGAGLLERLEAAGEARVLCGIYPSRTGAERRLVESAGPRLELLATVPMEVKDLRLLDDARAAEARAFRTAPEPWYDVRVYRYSAPAR